LRHPGGPNHNPTFKGGAAMTEKHLTTPEEIWKPIPGFPGYEVSDHGRVKSFLRQKPFKILDSREDTGGYPYVGLTKEGKIQNKSVHQLVLLAFIGPCPPGHESCHGDGVRSNCHLYNLRWDTKPANYQDRHSHGTENTGIKNGRAIINEETVKQIRQMAADGKSLRTIERTLNLTPDVVSKVVHRIRWKHVQ
jgi:hypothetical protein